MHSLKLVSVDHYTVLSKEVVLDCTRLIYRHSWCLTGDANRGGGYVLSTGLLRLYHNPVYPGVSLNFAFFISVVLDYSMT